MITSDDIDAMERRIEDICQYVEDTIANRLRDEVRTLRRLLESQ